MTNYTFEYILSPLTFNHLKCTKRLLYSIIRTLKTIFIDTVHIIDIYNVVDEEDVSIFCYHPIGLMHLANFLMNSWTNSRKSSNVLNILESLKSIDFHSLYCTKWISHLIGHENGDQNGDQNRVISALKCKTVANVWLLHEFTYNVRGNNDIQLHYPLGLFHWKVGEGGFLDPHLNWKKFDPIKVTNFHTINLVLPLINASIPPTVYDSSRQP